MRPIDVESPMCTTDSHDVVVGGAVIVGALVAGAVVGGAVVAADDAAPAGELAPSTDAVGAGAEDVLLLSTHTPRAASATATAAGRTVLLGNLIAQTRDASGVRFPPR